MRATLVKKQKRQQTFQVLAFFLGWAGIHNFYIGRAGRGILQLLLSLQVIFIPLTVLWSWIECSCVKEDADGDPLK